MASVATPDDGFHFTKKCSSPHIEVGGNKAHNTLDWRPSHSTTVLTPKTLNGSARILCFPSQVTANTWRSSNGFSCLLFCSSNAEFYRNLTAQPTTTVNQFFGHEMDSGSQHSVHQQDECSALNCEFYSAASLSGICGEFWTSEQYGVLDNFLDYAPQLSAKCGWPVFVF